MQGDWLYNRAGFIGPLPSPHSRRMCNPLPTLLSEVGKWGREILWKTRKQTQTSQKFVRLHDHWAMAGQGFLQQALRTVSRSALAPGAILLGFFCPGVPSTVSCWFYWGELDLVFVEGQMKIFLAGGWLYSCKWYQWIITDNTVWQKHLPQRWICGGTKLKASAQLRCHVSLLECGALCWVTYL